MLIQFLFSLLLFLKGILFFPGKKDKEDISGNPLLLVSHVRPVEPGIV